MPQTERQTSAQLDLRLEGGRPTFCPGDVVTGLVSRSAHLVTPHATVRISLHARSKSRMVVSHGSLSKTYRGRFDLIPEASTTQTLFDAPLHIPVDGNVQTWPFAITLPKHLDPSTATSVSRQDESFLTLDANSIAAQKMPPSFFLDDYGYGSGMECFVEYFLRAELRTTSRGAAKMVETIVPIQVPTLDTGAFDDSEFRESQNLLVAEQEAQRSASSEGQPLITPQPAVDIVVRTPVTLRLDQAEPAALYVLALPRQQAGADIGSLVAQDILITGIAVKIVISTKIKCHGWREAQHATTESDISLVTQKDYDDLGEMLFVPLTEAPVSATGTIRFDPETNLPATLGTPISLQLKDKKLQESFETYNIQHTHQVTWELRVQLGGRNFKASGFAPVTVAPPSSRSTPMEYHPIDPGRPLSAGQLPPGYSEIEGQQAPHDGGRPPKSGVTEGLSRLWLGL